MRIAADTNIIVRAITQDDPLQSAVAQSLLTEADMVVIAPQALCELVWVLSRSSKVPAPLIAEAIRDLIAGVNVVVDRDAVEAGLAMLDAGGDFADGVIAHEGRRQGADEFVSFDRQAVTLLKAQGRRARLIGD